MRKFLIAAAAIALPASPVLAQAPQLGAGQVMGNSTAAQRPARAEAMTAILDRAFSASQGASLLRSGASWVGVLNNPAFNVAAYSSLAAAITAARAAGNGTTVWVPCGTYALGSGAVGLDLTNASALTIKGASNLNAGAGQCVTVTYTGTGTMIDGANSNGLDISGIYFLATGAGAKMFNLTLANYANIHNNMILNTTSDANNIGIDLDVAQMPVIRRNNISVAGGIGVRGIGAAGTFSVKAVLHDNKFLDGTNIAISRPGQNWTVEDNVVQGNNTAQKLIMADGPAGSCDFLLLKANHFDDAALGPPGKNPVRSNCKSLTSISNRYTGAGGNVGILQDNSTGKVTSINDRFDGDVGINIGTGNYLYVDRGEHPTLEPVTLWSGTPANTNTVMTVGGLAQITGALQLGITASFPGQLLVRTAGLGSVQVLPPSLAAGAVITWPNVTGTLLNTANGVSVAGKSFDTTNSYTTLESAFTIRSAAGTNRQFQFVASSISDSTTRFYTAPNGNGTMAVSATSPLVLNATTGNLTCPTCALAPTGATALARVNIQTFCPAGCTTTVAGGGSGSYTPTTGLVQAVSECVGGGGGGGGVTGAASQIYGGGGGGSGSYCKTISTAATIGASQTVSIGSGGAGGAGSNNGTAGGASSVGALCTTNGGGGGGFSATGVQLGIGGNGAAAGTGTVVHPGNGGGGGYFNATASNIQVPSGIGGGSYFGGGANSALVAANSPGAAGQRGGGGSGAYTTTATGPTGGAGGAGYCMVTEYLNQ